MTLYDLLEQVSDILTPQTSSLYDYMVHTLDDDGGFLRIRFCYWDKPVPNFRITENSSPLLNLPFTAALMKQRI